MVRGTRWGEASTPSRNGSPGGFAPPTGRPVVVPYRFALALGDYGDFDEGVDATLAEGYAPGTFMVHLCVPREEELPRVYLSGRADFSGVMA